MNAWGAGDEKSMIFRYSIPVPSHLAFSTVYPPEIPTFTS